MVDESVCEAERGKEYQCRGKGGYVKTADLVMW